jgi:nitroreductase
MELLDAIYSRQSIGKVRQDAVPREQIEQILAAAVQAPNHHRVRPWRFFVLTGMARSRLGEIMAQGLQQRQPDSTAEKVEVERARPLRAPVVIAVGVDKPADPKVVEIENVCAAAAAVQNMLLVANSLGLGAIWRTGPAAMDPKVKAFFGLEADQHLIGFVYLGYPEIERKPVERPGFEDRTLWIEA